jgi:hypothetical protein
MKRPNWTDIYPSIQPQGILAGPLEQFQPKSIGRGIIGDVTVYLELRKNQNNKIFEAVVIGFNPPTAKIPDLKITDEVEIDILHFLPGR